MIKYCFKCLTPSSRPRIVFDEAGICNACHNAERKKEIDWDARKKEFLDYVERFRPESGPYDCIVPWSGGKDSTAIALKLKFEFGLNPLLVTASPLIPNEIAEHNREELLKLGFDQVMVRPNQKVARHLAKRFFIERGNPKVHWEATKEAAPLQAAVRYKIPLVFYAEHGESEYGGRVTNEEAMKIKDFTEVIEHIVGDDAWNWMDETVEEKDLAPYLYPEQHEIDALGIKALYFAYFFKWSMYENYEYVKEHIDFMTAPGGRTDGTFTNFDSLDDKIDTLYYYMQYIKFGFGRAVRDGSRMVQNNHLSREKALEFAKLYDDEFPHTYYREQLEYLNLSDEECRKIIDLHRNSEIFTETDKGWQLIHPLV
ncbi:N-acetyl sugar amidotransferase [Kiloniella litopenaei]|uniref:N-acetyl sugar amidotransferase n=1 Tax=Kiloniella litopenaei TaxID=1549748 RepID=UPI003BA9668D